VILDIGGLGAYRVVAFTTITFRTTYDAAGYVLVVVNMFVSAIASIGIIIAIFRVKNKTVQAMSPPVGNMSSTRNKVSRAELC
jgi:mannose/fructose/N-acetylgalactosamine-specific phosphotransferase system component IIC